MVRALSFGPEGLGFGPATATKFFGGCGISWDIKLKGINELN